MNMMKSVLATSAILMGIATAPAWAADPVPTYCKEQLEKVLSQYEINLADVKDVQQMKVGKQQPSIVTMMTPPGCTSGELRVTMWYTCTLQAINTVGDCKVKGVGSGPF